MKNERIGFTTAQVRAITGVTADQLNNWQRTNFLTPSVAPAPKTGVTRLYSFRDLVAIRVLLVLRKAGISQASLRCVVTYLRNRKGLSATEVLAQTTLVTDGHDVYEIDGEATTSLLRNPGQLGFIGIQLDRVVREIQANVALTEKAA